MLLSTRRSVRPARITGQSVESHARRQRPGAAAIKGRADKITRPSITFLPALAANGQRFEIERNDNLEFSLQIAVYN
jgi:hypothetical protein